MPHGTWGLGHAMGQAGHDLYDAAPMGLRADGPRAPRAQAGARAYVPGTPSTARLGVLRSTCPLDTRHTSFGTARRRPKRAGPDRGLGRRIPSWPAVAVQQLAGAHLPAIGAAAPRSRAVVPVYQIRRHDRQGPGAGPRTGPGRALRPWQAAPPRGRALALPRSQATTRSCTRSLRLIPQPDKPGKMPSFQHLYEGVLPCYRLCSSTSSR